MNNPDAENTQNNTQGISRPVLEMSAHIADLQRQADTLSDLKGKKGPASPEAKERVRYNALRHGFTGQVLIMPAEERESFDAFVKGMMTDFAPIGTHETFLANSIAEEAWRLNQIRARCSNLSAVGDFEGAGNRYRPMESQQPEDETDLIRKDAMKTAAVETAVARDHSKEFALMSLYAQRTQRAYEKYKKELNELQEKRKAAHAAELEEARLLFQLADTQGLAYDPRKDGFVFSVPFIRAYSERHHRLILAKRTESDYRKKHKLTEITRTAGKAA
jgi:hypothetical protein